MNTPSPIPSIAALLKPIERHAHRVRLPSLSLGISERKLLLAAADLLAINAALFGTLLYRADYVPEFAPTADNTYWFVLLSITWLIVALLMDVYSLARAASARNSVWTTGTAAIVTSVVYLLIPYVTPALPSTRLGSLLFVALAASSVSLWRFVYARVFVQPTFQQHALVVGAGQAGRTLAQVIAQTPPHRPAQTGSARGGAAGDASGDLSRGTGYQLLGFIDDDEQKQGSEVERVPVIGTRRDLLRLAKELQPDEIILAITNAQTIHDELFQAILDCRELGIAITTMPALFETLTGRVPVEHAGQDLTVVLPLRQSATHRIYLAARRLVDLLVSVLAFVPLCLLLVPCVWLANRLTSCVAPDWARRASRATQDTSPGRVFYWQERVGEGGKLFRVLKFRSMVADAEKETGAVWARENDARVTPVGRWLRRMRLDELPQLWNIFKGEMTLIGPRPERPEFVQSLAQRIPFYRVRHAVKPGLTGWAQINYRYGASVEDALVKLQYDLYYIKHQGLFLDLVILLKTI